MREPNSIPGGGKMPLERNYGVTGGSKLPHFDRDRDELSGVSIFDPVLCELMYDWFCPEFGSILDPFAGGSVRGIVAVKKNRNYLGVDLRKEQIESNILQADEILKDQPKPTWICGDSRNELLRLTKEKYDFVFSCPPYGDLELYSTQPEDLSNMDYKEEFLPAYYDIISHTYSLLKPDRFACFVVGDFRDKNGFYRNFVSHTIEGFIMAGYKLYNEAVLLTSIGSLPLRAGIPFKTSRKLGKTHQNVLVFVKGDPKEATKILKNYDLDTNDESIVE